MSQDLTITHWFTLHGLVTVLAVLIYVINSHVMRQRRPPAAAIGWMLFILLLPYLALPAFLTFGSRKLQRSWQPVSAAPVAPFATDAWAVETIMALRQEAPAGYDKLAIHPNGRTARDALMDTIEGANHSIDLCTFILGNDRIGDAVVLHLCRKATSGVRVRLLLDGLGRLMAGRPDLTRLTEAGGALALFVPPFHSPLKGRTNLRDHRKMVVADGTLASGRLWCGGRNLADEYFDGAHGEPAWRDLSFDLRGPLVRQALNLFERDWAFAGGLSAGVQAPRAVDTDAWPDCAQIVASGPDQVDDTVYSLLVTAAYRARRRIALATPYFVPETALLMALCLAARRGVSIDLLLPARSNHRLSDLARARGLRSLAQAGARVWLAPGMLHAKLAVIDDTLALAGSANLDSRSLFLNYELMVAFHTAADVNRFAAWFDRERVHAQPYMAIQPGLTRDVAEGLVLWLGFQL